MSNSLPVPVFVRVAPHQHAPNTDFIEIETEGGRSVRVPHRPDPHNSTLLIGPLYLVAPEMSPAAEALVKERCLEFFEHICDVAKFDHIFSTAPVSEFYDAWVRSKPDAPVIDYGTMPAAQDRKVPEEFWELLLHVLRAHKRSYASCNVHPQKYVSAVASTLQQFWIDEEADSDRDPVAMLSVAPSVAEGK